MARLVFFSNPWASTEIRARQPAECLKNLGVDVVIDPEVVYPDDTVVSIKVHPGEDVFNTVRNCYIDIVDSTGAMLALDKYPRSKAIAMSRLAYKYLSERYGAERIVFIPEHHFNFERNIRLTHWPVQTAGYLGDASCFFLDVEDLTQELRKIGVDFIFCNTYRNRYDVANFYGKIDLQITFRIDDKHIDVPAAFKNPLKLNNAGSCSIPSISYPEANYVDEWDGCFWPATSLGEIVNTVEHINRDKKMYRVMQSAALGRSELYHIGRVLPNYLELIK